jgi:hypothetical protein
MQIITAELYGKEQEQQINMQKAGEILEIQQINMQNFISSLYARGN